MKYGIGVAPPLGVYPAADEDAELPGWPLELYGYNCAPLLRLRLLCEFAGSVAPRRESKPDRKGVAAFVKDVDRPAS